MFILLFLIACDFDTAGSTTDTATPAGLCASETLGALGGTVTSAGIQLDIPADALDTDTLVELCPVTATDPAILGTPWEIRPVGLELLVPATLTLDHTGDEATSHLVTPGPGGAGWRNLEAVRPGVGSLQGPLYRLGETWVATDLRAQEPYVALEDGIADILFVVDNSCSMFNEQMEMTTAMAQVLPEVQTTNLDFHLGVVSTDLDNAQHSGKLRPAQGVTWVQADTPYAADVFSEMAVMGTNGSGTERGLGATYLALEVYKDTSNAGFLREGAPVSVVVVSDENDQTQASLITLDEFQDWFDGVKETPEDAAFHAMVSPAGGGVYSGSTYIDVALASGGFVGDIDVTPWLPFLEDVIDAVATQSLVMPLDPPAADGTVEVWWVPAGLEQVPLLDVGDFVYNHDQSSVRMLRKDLPSDELVVLWVPAP